MDRTRTLLLHRLVEVERHLVEFEQVLTRQRYVIETMARGGHDTTEACALLREFQGIQATHVADRDRFRVELMT